MEIKLKPSQMMGLVFLAIAFAAISRYIYIIDIFMVLVAIPFVLIGIKQDKMLILQSILTIFILLSFITGLSYSLNVTMIFVIPGLIMGYIISTSYKDKNLNTFDPVYGGIVAYLLCFVGYYSIEQYIIKSNIVGNMITAVHEFINDMLTQGEGALAGNELLKSISADQSEMLKNTLEIVSQNNYVIMMLIVTVVILSIIYALITYYISAFAVNRINGEKQDFAKFDTFGFPGNPVLVLVIIYIIAKILGSFNIGLKTDMYLYNLNYVFQVLFTIQGLVVILHFVKKFFRNRNIFMSFVLIASLVFTGGIISSFIGMLDSIFDFRKVRRSKST